VATNRLHPYPERCSVHENAVFDSSRRDGKLARVLVIHRSYSISQVAQEDELVTRLNKAGCAGSTPGELMSIAVN
jgi:hypothetical protein